ncbi:MAG: DUF4349 domain-containing protein [Marinilabilia sp.]
MKRTITTLLLSLLLFSCNQKNQELGADQTGYAEEEIMPMTRQEAVSPPPPPLPPIKTREVAKKKIIQDGRLHLRVDNLEESKIYIDSLVKSYNGYYANESYNNSEREVSYNLKIRIPENNFESFVNDSETGVGEVIFKEIQARDVTEEFFDLETRIENKKKYLSRYRELLDKAQNVKEILEIEEEIRGIEEELESTEGRLKYLRDLVDYSTLNLTLTKEKDFKFNPVNRDDFPERLKQSISKGWIILVDFFLFLIKLWPFWIIVSISVITWKKLKKKRKN